MLRLALSDPLSDPCTGHGANQSQWGHGAPVVASPDHGAPCTQVVLERGLVPSGTNFQSEVIVFLQSEACVCS